MPNKLDKLLQRTRLVLAEFRAASRRVWDGATVGAHRPLAELYQLEQRVLFSASPVAACETADQSTTSAVAGCGLAGLVSAPTDDANLNPGSGSHWIDTTLDLGLFQSHIGTIPAAPEGASQDDAATTDAKTQETRRLELVFVDATADNYEQLLANLRDDPSVTFDVFVLDADRDGIEQIAEVLAELRDVDAVHLVSHGTAGTVKLGATWLSADNVDAFRAGLSGWRAALNDDADLLFYGCDLAENNAGQNLLAAIGELTGADVAASTDATGQRELGGDWELEFLRGEVTTAVAFSEFAQTTWAGLLGITSFREGVNGYTGTQDTFVEASAPTTTHGVDATVMVMGTPSTQGLIRFDNLFGTGSGQIPYGSTITSAALVVDVGTGSSPVANLELHRMLVAWNELSTWNSLTAGVAIDDIEAATPADSVLASPAGTSTQTFAGLESTVQLWSNGATNLGWVVTSNSSNDWSLASSEAASLGTRPQLFVTYNPPTLIATNETRVNTTTVGSQQTMLQTRGSHRSVDIASDGNYVVVWSSENQDGEGLGIFGQRFDRTGRALGGEFQINETITADQQYASVASDVDGNFVVTWTSNQSGDNDIYMRRYNRDGDAIGGELRVNTTTSNEQINATIAMDRVTGDYIVVWQGFGAADSNGIYFRRFDGQGNSLDVSDQSATGATAAAEIDPTVTMLPRGEFVIAWENTNHIYFQKFDASGSAVGSLTQADLLALSSSGPAISSDAAGNFTLVFSEALTGIWAIGLNNDGSTKFALLRVDVGDGESPALDVLADGKIVGIVHKSTDGNSVGVFRQIYNENGVVTQASTVVNDTTSGKQANASVAALDENNYVVAWSGNGTGDNSGVFVKQFGTATTSVLTVTTTSDVSDGDTTSVAALLGNLGADGKLSLREAIVAANNTPGANTIQFQIADALVNGAHTITPTAGLPTITDTVTIDGFTDTDAGSTPIITLDGSAILAGGVNGLTLAANSSTIRGLSIVSFSGNGLLVTGSANTISENYFGVAVDGVSKSGNGAAGIFVGGANNTIGSWNLIGDNGGGGVYFEGATATGNRVIGNAIGMDFHETYKFANAFGVQFGTGASLNDIGGVGAGEGNLIAQNSGPGIMVVSGSGNRFTNNQIFANTGLAIDLNNDNLTANDVNDGDSGPNNLQNFPTISSVSVSGSNVTIDGQFNSLAGKSYELEFFRTFATAADVSSHGEASTSLGTTTISTDSNGNATFHVVFSGVVLSPGDVVTATATRWLNGGGGETSEFAQNVAPTFTGAPGISITEITPNSVSTETRVNTTTSGEQWSYYWSARTVAMAADGSYVTVWIDTGGADGNQYGIYGQRFDAAGVAQGAEFRINTSTAGKQDNASVAIRDNGDFIVLWDGPGDGSSTGIWGQRFLANGTPVGAEFQLNTTTNGIQQYPEVDFAADGSFVAAWVSHQGGGGAKTVLQRFDANANKVGGEVLLSSNNAADQILDSLTVKADGSVVVSWTESDDVYIRLYDSSLVPVTSAIVANTTTTDVQQYIVARTDANGGIVAVWESNAQDGSGNGVFGQRFSSDGMPTGGEFQITSQTAGDQFAPVVAVDPFGNFVVSWTDGNAVDGSAESVWLQRFDMNGNRVGDALMVNQTTAGYQAYSVMDMNSLGQLVVNWEGNGTGDSYGVFTRRFDTGPQVTEGGTKTFRVVLDTAPTGTVTFSLTNSNPAEISLSTSQLTFDVSNWSIPQVVTITGVQDFVVDGQQAALIVTSSVTSTDVGYQGLNPDDVPVTIVDSAVVNSAPVLDPTRNPVLAAINEDAAAPAGAVGTLVSSLVDFAVPSGQVDNVTDADVSPLLGIAVTGADAANGTWWYTIDGGTNWLTLGTVSDTASRLLAANASTRIYFQPNANFNGSLAAAITFRAWDQVVGTNGSSVSTMVSGGTTAFSTATDTASLVVSAVNDVPLNVAPGSRTTLANNSLVFSSTNGSLIAVSDVDAGAGSLRVTLTTTNGVSSLNGTSGLSFTSGDGTADATMTFTGTIAAINTALDGLTFAPTPGFTGSASLSISTNDQGNTGSGGNQSDTDVVAINVVSANNAWLWLNSNTGATTSGGVTWTDDEIVNFGAPNLAFEPGTTSGTFSAITNLSNLAADGKISLSGLHHIRQAVTVGTGNNAVALQRGDLLFSVQQNETFGGVGVTDKDLVLFRPTTPNNYTAGTFSILLNSPTGDKLREVSVVETNTTVGGVNLAAGDFLLVLSSATYDKNISRFQATSVGNGTTIGTLTTLIDGGDIGINQQIGAMELVQHDTSIGNASLTTGQILLSLRSNDNTVGDNSISVTKFDIFSLDVTQAGATTTANATLLFQGADVGLSSNGEEFYGLTLVVTNYAPSISSGNALTSITEDPTSNPGTDVAQLIAGKVSDPDPNTTFGIAVTGVDSANGSWQYSLDAGSNWTSLGAVSEATARLLSADAATRVRFVPNANWNGSATISFRAWDQTTGVAGATADVSSNGGNSAYSAGSVTSTQAVTPVNDAPTVALQNVTASLPENTDTSSAIKVADIVVTDDGQGTNTLSLAGADSVLFEIVGLDLRLKAGTTLDFETQTSLQVTVNVDDAGIASFPDASASASIAVTNVNDTAPVATADSYTTSADQKLVVAAGRGVLVNDSDIDGDALQVAIITSTSHGTLDLRTDGSFTYLPDPNYFGPDAFSYQVTDGLHNSNTVNVAIAVSRTQLASLTDFRVNTTTTDVQETLAENRGSHRAVAMSPAGDYVVVWSSNNQDGGGWGVYGQRYNRLGVAQGAEFRVNQFTNNDQRWATVAMNQYGRFVVSWTSENQDGTSHSIYARVFNADGTAATNEFRVNADGGAVQANGSVDMDADGNFVVVWEGTGPGDSTGIFGRRFNAAGIARDASEFRLNTATDGSQADTAVAMNDRGDFVAVWDDGDGVHARRYNSAGVALEASQTTISSNVFAGQSSVEVANDGSYVVVWRDTNNGARDTFLRRYSAANNPLGAATLVNQTTTNDQTNPSITMDTAANFIVAWEGNGPGDTAGVFYRKYAANGVALTNEIRINQTATNSQHSVSLAMLDLENFVAVWSGSLGLETAGVFARQIGSANTAPVAFDDSYSVNEDTLLVVPVSGVLQNDTDTESNPLTATLVTGPAHGTLLLNNDGSFSYRPSANFQGSDSFTYVANDGADNSNTATVTILVNATNDPPVARNDAFSVSEDAATLTGNLITNPTADSDPDSDPLLIDAVNGDAGLVGTPIAMPSGATLTVNADGSYSYQLNGQFQSLGNGQTNLDSFTYRLVGKANPWTARMVQVTGNQILSTTDAEQIFHHATGTGAITANGKAYNVSFFGDQTISLIDYGNGVAGGSLNDHFDVNNTLPNGVADGGDNYVVNARSTWNVPAGTYTIALGSDDGGLIRLYGSGVTFSQVFNSGIAAGSNQIRFEAPRSFSVTGGTFTVTAPTQITVEALAFEHDFFSTMEVSLAAGTHTSFAAGAFQLLTQGTLGWAGLTSSAAVGITVNGVNDAPVAVADSYTTNEDTPLTISATGVLANDTDIDSATLTAIRVTNAAHGTVTLNANGSFTYTPDANFNGTDSFTYKTNDGAADSNVTTVTLTVNAVNDAPVAAADSYSTNEDTPLTISATGVLANDTDIDSATLTAIRVTNAAHGTVTLNANGSFTYTPDANFNGTDSFTYKANDGAADSNVTTVTLTVNAVNDAPVAAADAVATNENTPITIAAATLLANDQDVDGNALSIVLENGPLHGSLQQNVDGSLTYTPNAGFAGNDTFTYKANDGAANSNSATVAITVHDANSSPTAAADSFTMFQGAPLTITPANLTANDNDPDADPLTVAIVTQPSQGQLTLNGNGAYTYTPNTGFLGTDTFTYQVSDGVATSNVVTVSIRVDVGGVLPGPVSPGGNNSNTNSNDSSSNNGTPSDSGSESSTHDATVPNAIGPTTPTNDVVAPPSPTITNDNSANAPAQLVDSAEAIADLAWLTGTPQETTRPIAATQHRAATTVVSAAVEETETVVASPPPPTSVTNEAFDFSYMTPASTFWRELDKLDQDLGTKVEVETIVVGSVGTVASSFTVGYVLWALRSGFILSSLLASMPAWTLIDPLAVVPVGDDANRDADDESLEQLVEKRKAELHNQHDDEGQL